MTFSYPDSLLHKWVAIDAGESGGTLAHVFGIQKQFKSGQEQSVEKIVISTDVLIVSTFGKVQIYRQQRAIELNGKYPYKVYDSVEDMRDDIFIDSLKLNRDSTVMLARKLPELSKFLRGEDEQ